MRYCGFVRSLPTATQTYVRRSQAFSDFIVYRKDRVKRFMSPLPIFDSIHLMWRTNPNTLIFAKTTTQHSRGTDSLDANKE
ncbi:hypothetical protein RRG08_012693 [Elysia crispata]|nr:hypothetical protein RRG08_012693 [Elysia crispata]